MTDPIIRTIGLGKEVPLESGRLAILNEVFLEVKAGESLAILGASGSGKSTLLGLLAGLDVPTRGQVYWNGQEIFALDEDARAALRGRLAGFVFQSFHLLPALTAWENVMLPLELTKVPDARQRARDILERVGLRERLNHYPRQLSGGEQQRVAVARAFVTRPAILFADEPTGNLDETTGARVIDLLFDLNREQGTTLILVTHDPALAGRCQRRLLLQGGRLGGNP
ncbi:MAG: ABC transporter ATP-binding protein [Burkholderiales bacterium]|nr:ABC transporter ATP-binding protein [Burkholderiales bacterium]